MASRLDDIDDDDEVYSKPTYHWPEQVHLAGCDAQRQTSQTCDVQAFDVVQSTKVRRFLHWQNNVEEVYDSEASSDDAVRHRP